MLEPGEDLPWAGHSARHAFPQIYELIKQHKMTLVFVNTRSQAEMIFHALWHINDDRLAIALHHGSLDVGAAPQGRGRDDGGQAARGGLHLVARSRHRLGRHRSRHQRRRAEGLVAAAAAHRPRQPSARRAVARHSGAGQPLRGAGMQRRDRRGRRPRAGHAAAAHRRARRAGAARARQRLRRAVRRRRALSRGEDRRALRRPDRAPISTPCVDFVATGGYALKAYERFAKIRQTKDGRWRVAIRWWRSATA